MFLSKIDNFTKEALIFSKNSILDKRQLDSLKFGGIGGE